MADELVKRAVDVLLKLRTLSEVPARRYDAQQTSHTAENELPVQFTSSGDLAPVEPSEFLFHRGQINASNTRLDFEVAVLAAEDAWRTLRKQDYVPSERMTPSDMRAQVIDWHRAGLSVAEIAYKGDLKVRWVQWVIRTAPPRPEDNA
jgi:hypothetical protein